MAILLQQIVNYAAARLDDITVANGYHLNLGSYNDVDRPTGKQVVDWNASIVIPSEEFLDELSCTVERHELTLDVELVRVGATAPLAELIQAIADVRKALGTDRTFGGLIEDITPAGFTKPKSQLGEYVAGMMIVQFKIHYRTTIFQEA